MHSAKRVGLALAIVSTGWLAASAFRATSVPPQERSNRESPIRRELPMQIRSDQPRIDESAGESPTAAGEPDSWDQFPRLDRVPRIGQNPAE